MTLGTLLSRIVSSEYRTAACRRSSSERTIRAGAAHLHQQSSAGRVVLKGVRRIAGVAYPVLVQPEKLRGGAAAGAGEIAVFGAAKSWPGGVVDFLASFLGAATMCG